MELKEYFLAVKWVCNTNCSFCNFYEAKWKIDEIKHLNELKNEIDGVVKKWILSINVWINAYEPTSFTYLPEILSLSIWIMLFPLTWAFSTSIALSISCFLTYLISIS